MHVSLVDCIFEQTSSYEVLKLLYELVVVSFRHIDADHTMQAGVEPDLGSAVRLLCQCVLSPEPQHCYLCRGQPAPAGHEVPGKGRAGQLQLPE